MKKLAAAIITLSMLAMLGACAAEEPPLPGDAHPFAVALQEHKALLAEHGHHGHYGFRYLPGTTNAFLVELDDQGTPGMLVFSTYVLWPPRISFGFFEVALIRRGERRTAGMLYYLRNGALAYSHARGDRANFYTVDASNRMVHVDAIGFSTRYSRFHLLDYDEEGTRQIYSLSLSGGFCQDYGHEGYSLITFDGTEQHGRPITLREFEELRVYHGFDNLRPCHWWESHPNDNAEILAMTR